MASFWRRAPTPSAARSPICRRRGCPASWSTARSIPRSIRSASTIARRCANLVDHVAGLGHRRIGYIGGHPGFPDDARAHRRLPRFSRAARTCVRRALSRQRRRIDRERRRGDPRPFVAPRSADRDRDRQQHGDDRGDAGRSRARGLRVPADISIAGFDDFEWADCFEPRLTLVAQPCEEIGRRAAFLLMERIAAPEGARRTVRLDAALRLRDSCGRPR